MYEVIWHGRGGQGVVIAAQILAESAYMQGFKGVTSAPTFGPERRGAPLTASTKVSETPIRTFAQIEFADIAVVLDASLLKVIDIHSSLRPGGLVILNTPLKAEEAGIADGHPVAVVDGAGIAFRHHLIKEGAPMVNTPLLGAFARAVDWVSLDFIEKGLKSKLSSSILANNLSALRDAYESTRGSGLGN